MIAGIYALWNQFTPQPQTFSSSASTSRSLDVVGLGDGLTSGVGDTTGAGGYLTLLKNDLTTKDTHLKVHVTNKAEPAATLAQTQKHLKKQSVQTAVQHADVLTVSVGTHEWQTADGQKQKGAAKTKQQYTADLKAYLRALRKLNRTAPIYVLGIYSTATTEPASLVQWNANTKTIANQVSRTEFVPLNAALQKGETTAASSSNSTSADKNQYIFNEDHFHPSSKGYDRITAILYKSVVKHGNLPKKGGSLRMIGIGDSLTHGVGDTTKQGGGYVRRLQSTLKKKKNITVKTNNFGVNGNMSTQILSRVKNDATLRNRLQRADLITVTAGGNDMLGVLQKDFFKLDQAKLKQGGETYQQNLAQLLKTIRQVNPDAPIFVLSLYNPFYVYFPKMTSIQTTIKAWNKVIQQEVKATDHAYYVNIDAVLTKGKQTKAKATHTNRYLNEGTKMPNNTGYQVIEHQLLDTMNQHRSWWLTKEEE
ncbi:Lysophospholipase L1 related esterase [Lactobacillus selangorensis]|uniref:Lysophospholipase L1 related esterase n=1 Tax=Lactobacillus selangorensis TaxID=81857 RepID=A0A0R2FW02_9LACO|nr:GDSL-type esterase/lipase family protein [Lactobacillus selangorensis]KRN29452.1 Lysophospholipase L1 related esterase [Lactobacillus selangorensis]KRN34019.1 Lysophospholipase L1 related esterase [Lactobacillus selangorensis]